MTAREFAEPTADTDLRPAAARRTAPSSLAAGNLLALQAGAGNGAVTRMLTVQRDARSTTTDTSATGWQASSAGLGSTDTRTTTESGDGPARTTTDTSNTSIDSTGFASKHTTATKVTDGENSSSFSTTRDRKLDVAGGGLNYTSGTTDKSERDGNSTTIGSTSTIGTGGRRTTREETRVTGDQVDSEKSTTSWTRGDGKLGWGTSVTDKNGTQDNKGALIKGTETTSSGGAAVIAGPDGVGGSGSLGKDYSQTHRKGVKTGQTLGLDGKVVANVSEVPGSEPARYQVSLTVSISGKVGLSGSGEHKSEEQGGKVSASASLSGSLAGTGTFVHIFSGDEAQQYLTQATAQGADSGPKELRVIKLLASGKLGEAKALLDNVQASLASPDGALAMKDGESAAVSVDFKGDLSGKAGGEMAGLGATVSGGVGRSGSLKRTVTRKGGKAVVSISVTYAQSLSYGGTASFEMASGGYQNSSTESRTEAVTFTLDPDNHAYPEQYALLSGISGPLQVEQVRLAHPDLVTGYTSGGGSSSTGTTTAGVGPIGIEMPSSGGADHTTTVDASGRTDNYSGFHGGGATLTGPAGFRMGEHYKENVSATVGPDGKAAGDLSTTTTETGWTAPWEALKKAWGDNKLGLITGSAKLTKDTVEVAGMTLSDGDFATIAAVAADRRRWGRAVVGPDYEAWMALGSRIVAARQDRRQIAEAMTRYESGHDGAGKAFQSIVRSIGSTEGGTLYDWPADLSAEKSSYAALITGDPLAAVRAQQAAGNSAAALETAKGALAKITALVAAMREKQDKFSDGNALGQMLVTAANRQAEVARQVALLSHGPDGVALPAADVTTVPTAEQAAAKSEADTAAAKAELNGLITAMKAFEAQQGRSFVTVQKEDSSVFLGPSTATVAEALNELRHHVYPAWEQTLLQARDAAKRAGLDPWAISPVPGKGFFDDMHQAHFGTRIYTPKPKSS